jgi:hypothetical protein
MRKPRLLPIPQPGVQPDLLIVVDGPAGNALPALARLLLDHARRETEQADEALIVPAARSESALLSR